MELAWDLLCKPEAGEGRHDEVQCHISADDERVITERETGAPPPPPHLRTHLRVVGFSCYSLFALVAFLFLLFLLAFLFLLFFVCFGCFSFLVILAGFSFLLFVFLVKNSEGEAEEEFADENVDPEIELCSA